MSARKTLALRDQQRSVLGRPPVSDVERRSYLRAALLDVREALLCGTISAEQAARERAEIEALLVEVSS